MSWSADARCLDAPRGVMDLDRDDVPRARLVHVARWHCTDCPVVIRCLQEAMREEAGWPVKFPRDGMRGALTGTQRTLLARTAGAVPEPAALASAVARAVEVDARCGHR